MRWGRPPATQTAALDLRRRRRHLPPQPICRPAPVPCRERRIAERRERVEERLRLQRAKQGEQRMSMSGCASAGMSLTLPCSPLPHAAGGSYSPQPAEQAAPARGTEQAARSAATVADLHATAAAQVEAVRARAEQRTEAHRDACDAEEAALRDAVAAEAEASRRENRAIDLEWEHLQASVIAS